jgi:hypothetical protein
MPPLVSVQSIQYVDIGGTLQSLNVSPSADLVTISTGTPGQIAPAFGTFFPLTRPQLSAVNITYTCGYSDDASLVPATVIQAIRILVADYYEHRTEPGQMSEVVSRLLSATDWGGY